MTLTELRYVVAVARERHFGRAADACFVSQPTLSVAVKKLEEELGITIFERGNSEIGVTPVGAQLVVQMQRVLDQTAAIKETAGQGKDPLRGSLRLGIIYTIGPYVLPEFMQQMNRRAPRMPLILQENYTVRLLELLKAGDIDVAIMALPFPESGILARPVYDEPFVVAVPKLHPWASRKSVEASELKEENMLLLGAGHCFRDQVLEVCPELSRFAPNPGQIQQTFEGSSLETIRHMVASGVGITVLPQTSIPHKIPRDSLLRYIPFDSPVPNRRVVLAWRKTFPREAAIDCIYDALKACDLAGVEKLSMDAVPA